MFTFLSNYTCVTCGTRYCTANCLKMHQDTRQGDNDSGSHMCVIVFSLVSQVPQVDRLEFSLSELCVQFDVVQEARARASYTSLCLSARMRISWRVICVFVVVPATRHTQQQRDREFYGGGFTGVLPAIYGRPIFPREYKRPSISQPISSRIH